MPKRKPIRGESGEKEYILTSLTPPQFIFLYHCTKKLSESTQKKLAEQREHAIEKQNKWIKDQWTMEKWIKENARAQSSATIVCYTSTELLVDSLNNSGVSEAVTRPEKEQSSRKQTNKNLKRYWRYWHNCYQFT